MPEVNYCFTPPNNPHFPGVCILWDDQENVMNSSWENKPKTIENKFYHNFTKTALANQEIDWLPDVMVSKNQEAIIQETLLTSSEDEIQDLIFKIKTSNVISNKVEIANRLLILHNFSIEEEPDSISISVESLRNFYSFLLKNIKLTPPTISLSPDNYIYASWRGENGQLLSVLFLADKNVRFVVFKPNPRHPEQKIRIAGHATFDVLMETVAPYDIEGWVL